MQRQLKWYVDQFHVEHPGRWDDPRRRPASDGPIQEVQRSHNPNHFEGQAASIVPPEPKLVAAVPHEIDETKPTSASPALRNDEKKPTEWAESTVPAATSFVIEPPTFVHDYSNERGRHHSRPRRAGEMSREYARRQKAARRRTSLALVDLI